MIGTIHSDTVSALGEGVFWHPERQSVFWFDILGHRLYEKGAEGQRSWQFDSAVSAAARMLDGRLIVASASALFALDLETGAQQSLVALEADTPTTRSNDGRADPQGGFWIGTMGYHLETGAGAIYRYYKGELRKLFDGISIPNAICFTPDGRHACYTDTPTQVIRKVALDGDGWPIGRGDVFIDLRADGLNPDGAVIDAEGCLWNAQWGASRVARYGTDGAYIDAISFPATQISCPAFGGPGMTTLFATSAAEGQPQEAQAGLLFACETQVQGQTEHIVAL